MLVAFFPETLRIEFSISATNRPSWNASSGIVVGLNWSARIAPRGKRYSVGMGMQGHLSEGDMYRGGGCGLSDCYVRRQELANSNCPRRTCVSQNAEVLSSSRVKQNV